MFFRTGWEECLGREKYFDHPELSMEIIEWLCSKEINMVGIDALGVGRLKNHGAYDRFLVDRDVFVIENLTNLKSIDNKSFKVYCLPLNIEGSDALLTRVIVET